MSRPDRRHAHGVARRVERALGDEATRPVLAAALLHDVGKTDARLRTYGRVVATLSAAVAGREMAEVWRNQSGFIRRVGPVPRPPRASAPSSSSSPAPTPSPSPGPASTTSPRTSGRSRAHLGAALKDADDD